MLENIAQPLNMERERTDRVFASRTGMVTPISVNRAWNTTLNVRDTQGYWNGNSSVGYFIVGVSLVGGPDVVF